MAAWSGADYDAAARPQAQWGVDVVARLDVPPGGLVLDAGCGSGLVTETLLRAHPGVNVVALDVTDSMLDQARVRLDPFGDRVRFVQGDLAGGIVDALDGARVDAVLSTGAFHWVHDHGALFIDLATVLAPGGSLVAQAGGAGSLARVRAVLDDVGIDWRSHNRYAEAAETADHLRAAGFVDVWTWLQPAPFAFDDGAALAEFLYAGALSPYLVGRPDDEQREVCREVADRLGDPVADFVRLNLLARRA